MFTVKKLRTTYCLTAITFIIIGFTIYFNSLNVPFYFDDTDNIQNPALQINELSWDSLLNAVSKGISDKRPIANLSFAINYYLHGYDVPGYHIVNILIHIITAFAFFTFLHLTLTIPENAAKYKNAPLMSFIIALIWLVHPLATQSVTYIVQRMNSLAVMFYLLSLICYIKSRLIQQTRTDKSRIYAYYGFVLCALFSILAFGSKEIAATLPIMILCYEIYFFHNLKLRVSKKSILWSAIILSLITGLMYIYLGDNPWRIFSSTCTGRDFTVYERVLTQSRIVMHYISLIVFPAPSRLVFDYNFPLSISLFHPLSTFFASLTIFAMFTGALLLATKERLLSFCILAFLLTLIIESSIICLEMIFEHRTYFPSMFLLTFCCLIFSRTIKSKKTAISSLCMLAILFGFWTIKRNQTWQDPVIFWTDSVKKYPNKARSHSNLGCALFRNNNFKEAENQFQIALALKAKFPEALHNLGIVSYQEGRNKDAIYYYKKAIALRPRYIDARISLAQLLEAQGKWAEADQQLQQSFKYSKSYPLLNMAYGHFLVRKGEPKKAIGYLEQALDWLPEDVNTLLDTGEAYIRLGEFPKALVIYRKVLHINPTLAGAHYNLALLTLSLGNESEALRHYRESIKYGTANIPTLYNTGNLLFRLGNSAEAKKYYLDFLRLETNLSDTYNNLGLIMLTEKNTEKAVQYFESALRINPSHQLALKNLEQATKEIDATGEQNTTD